MVLASLATSLDVFNSDIHLRLDVLGDTLSLWAWADGTPEPGTPQLTATDLFPITGNAGEESAIVVIGQRLFISTAVFRFVDVTPIPEPSTGLPVCLGLAVLATRRGQGQYS